MMDERSQHSDMSEHSQHVENSKYSELNSALNSALQSRGGCASQHSDYYRRNRSEDSQLDEQTNFEEEERVNVDLL